MSGANVEARLHARLLLSDVVLLLQVQNRVFSCSCGVTLELTSVPAVGRRLTLSQEAEFDVRSRETDNQPKTTDGGRDAVNSASFLMLTLIL